MMLIRVPSVPPKRWRGSHPGSRCRSCHRPRRRPSRYPPQAPSLVASGDCRYERASARLSSRTGHPYVIDAPWSSGHGVCNQVAIISEYEVFVRLFRTPHVLYMPHSVSCLLASPETEITEQELVTYRCTAPPPSCGKCLRTKHQEHHRTQQPDKTAGADQTASGPAHRVRVHQSTSSSFRLSSVSMSPMSEGFRPSPRLQGTHPDPYGTR